MFSKVIGIAVLLATSWCQPAVSQQAQSVATLTTLGSGPIGGGYYSAARVICDSYRAVAGSAHRCSPDPTPGSLYNLEALLRGELDFALTQSDHQRSAYEGTGHFSGRSPASNLRSVIALFPEPLTLLVRNDVGITSADELAGLRVDRGRSISGRRATVDKLLGEVGLEESDFGRLTEYTSNVALSELCAGQLDAVFLVIGHPNRAVAGTLSDCEVSMIGLSDAVIDGFVDQNPDYSADRIPAGVYPELASEIRTVSVMATVVTRSDVDDTAVRTMTLAVLENASGGRRAAPVMAVELSAQTGLSAPIHVAAKPLIEALADQD